ncbi:MAG: hypothetical protein J6C39_01480 [Clostridia bacterium]|nr:hypothetical protein [Clostridia bacterium]
MNSLEARKQEREAQREAGFARAEEVIGKEATDALRDLYKLYDEGIYVWMANLWDKDMGGFYFSNSARDTAGYFPDLESTLQVLDNISWSGAMDGYKNPDKPNIKNYANALSAETKAKIVEFVNGMQNSEDGFFYHPQWGKSITNSRRGRDLNWATYLLSNFEVKPLYDTPSGVKGSLGAPLSSMKKDSAKGSSQSLPPFLRSIDNFKKFLLNLDIPHNSYMAGNEIESQFSQIMNADRKMWLKECAGRREADYDVSRPAKGGYIETLIDFLNRIQDPETGMWEKSDNAYRNMNGLMKVSMSYVKAKVPLPNAHAAVRSVVSVARLYDANADTHVCSIFNTWRTIGDMLRAFNPEESAEIRKIIAPDITLMIRATIDNLSTHKRADGGFSYFKVAPCNSSQGAPVGCVSIAESDVNATTISTMGIPGSLCSAIGIPFIKPYSPLDGEYFLKLIANAKPITKKQRHIGDLFTYRNGEPKPLIAVWPDINRIANATVELDKGGRVVFRKQFDRQNTADCDENIRFEIVNSRRHDNGYQVFECDFLAGSLSGRSGNFLTIRMISGDERKDVRLYAGEAGEIYFADKDGTPVSGAYLEQNKNYKLRLEYYYVSLEKEIKLYIDGKLFATLINLDTASSSDKKNVNLSLSAGFDGAFVSLDNIYAAFVDGPMLVKQD